MDRTVRWVVFALAFVGLVLDAGGGPGWGDASARAVLAVQQKHLAASPLFDLLTNIAALLPAGEPGFRLGILAALLGAFTLAGIVAATTALFPREPSLAFAPVILLAITPAFRDAAAFASPSLLAACGAAWSIAFAARFARAPKQEKLDGSSTRAVIDSRDAPDEPARRVVEGGDARHASDGDARHASDGDARELIEGDARDASDGDASDGDARDVVRALVCCVLVIGSAPWLGAAWTIAIAAWLIARAPSHRASAPASDRTTRALVAAVLVGIGLTIILLWVSARGSLPGASGSAAATLAATGRGPAAIVVGAGLLGAGFGALTRLPNAAWLVLLAVIAGVHDVLVGGAAVPLLVVLAVGSAIIAGGIVRAAARESALWKRNLVGLGAGLPLVAIALATGATVRVDDPGSTPAQLARDLEGAMPPGPGVFVATRTTDWLALDYASLIAGARPDLALAPPMPPNQADAVVADALRAHKIAGADAAAFGRLDLRWAIPRRRGFQLVGGAPDHATPVEAPAVYATARGREQSILLALERARHEAASDRLDAAARALGFAGNRFGAADLAVLAATMVTKDRPALFGLLPLGSEPVGPWLLDLFGDDLAWVAGIAIPELPADAPMPRRLHAKWRAIIEGKGSPDDADIAAMGPDAVAATKAMFR